MATKLILIRHGQTSWNSKKRYSGSIDIALNTQGRKQAKKLAKLLNDKEIHNVYSSDRLRALQTARIIFKHSEIEIIPGLREIHFGRFEGLTHKEIMVKYPNVYKKWLHNPFAITIPEGEALVDFQKRVVTTFEKIVSSNKNKTAAIVCHGGTISIFISHIRKTKKFWEQIPSSASLSIIEYKNNKANICLLNDTSHL
ncbi:MAG: histidine phosphatase family protein [Candidatus Omnitrophota bacterium]|nr:histidine phosphatase family protein [Candidatus Omnitrophota bacterium]